MHLNYGFLNYNTYILRSEVKATLAQRLQNIKHWHKRKERPTSQFQKVCRHWQVCFQKTGRRREKVCPQWRTQGHCCFPKLKRGHEWRRVHSHIDEEKQTFTTLTIKSISKEEAHVGLNIYSEFLSLLGYFLRYYDITPEWHVTWRISSQSNATVYGDTFRRTKNCEILSHKYVLVQN